MAVHTPPGYALEETLDLTEPDQYRALFEETRLQIVDLLLERAATIRDLSEALDRPKGTIGHHVGVLADAGLIRVVRTKKIRAMEARYYGRSARTYLLSDKARPSFLLSPGHFFIRAAAEYEKAVASFDREVHTEPLSTLRYVRIRDDKAAEWSERLIELAREFTTEERGGATTYGLVLGLYSTDRPHLPTRVDE